MLYVDFVASWMEQTNYFLKDNDVIEKCKHWDTENTELLRN